MPTSFSSSSARVHAWRVLMPMCRRSTSAIWSPTVNTGFSEVIGSWKITEISLPRICRIASSAPSAGSRPSKSTSLSGEMIACSRGSRRMIDIAETDLPLPDSPTSATVEFVGTSNDMPLTASKIVPPSSRKLTPRFLTSSMFFHVSCLGRYLIFGSSASRSESVSIENAVTSIAIEMPAAAKLPPFADHQFVLRLGEHGAPRDHIHRHAQAEEGQDHLGLDELHHVLRKLHQAHVADVGQDVHEHAAAVRGADRLRRLHVFARAVLDVLGAHQAVDAGPAGEPEDDDNR